MAESDRRPLLLPENSRFFRPSFRHFDLRFPVTGASMSSLTYGELVWPRKRIENYARFGKVGANSDIDRSRRVISFSSGSIFAFVRWTANDFGIVALGIDILRAVTAVGVSPDNWLHAHGRLAARQAPRPYSRQRRQALLLRRRIEL